MSRRKSLERQRAEIGLVARLRGEINEERLLAAVIALRSSLPWLRAARQATPEEDRRGIDVVADSDVGALFLQSKSSHGGALRFRAEGRPLPIEPVVVSIDDATTARRASVALCLLRAAFVRRMAAGRRIVGA